MVERSREEERFLTFLVDAVVVVAAAGVEVIAGLLSIAAAPANAAVLAIPDPYGCRDKELED